MVGDRCHGPLTSNTCGLRICVESAATERAVQPAPSEDQCFCPRAWVRCHMAGDRRCAAVDRERRSVDRDCRPAHRTGVVLAPSAWVPRRARVTREPSELPPRISGKAAAEFPEPARNEGYPARDRGYTARDRGYTARDVGTRCVTMGYTVRDVGTRCVT